jgi:hypothetical protein
MLVLVGLVLLLVLALFYVGLALAAAFLVAKAAHLTLEAAHHTARRVAAFQDRLPVPPAELTPADPPPGRGSEPSPALEAPG